MKIVLALDGDNTLWDTDAVFRGAQLDMLNVFSKAGLIAQPDLELLRGIDQSLVTRLGQAEYDFRLLSTALAYYSSQGSSIPEAVDAAMSHATLHLELIGRIIGEAYQQFKRGMTMIPDLYPDTLAALRSIRASISPLVTILFSEGKIARVERILESHGIRQGLFNQIILAPKNEVTFKQVKDAGLQLLPPDYQQVLFVMVGDSLHRDIKLANQAGFITVYKPSAFKGLEEPKTPEERPTYTIERLSDLPLILTQLIKSEKRQIQ